MSIDREASATVYLMEELGDARLRCDQLVRYLADVVKLVEQSKQRDHLFEVAGHLIREIPETAFKLQKALQAVSLAADRLDYEELKRELRPEKVEELERVLKEVRIRPVQHRSQPSGVPNMLPRQAAAKLREIAAKTRKLGSVPVEDLVGLIRELSAGHVKQASVQVDPADVLERLATTLETTPKANRDQLAVVLTRLAKDVAFTDIAKQADVMGLEATEALAMFERILDSAKISFRFMGNNKLKPALGALATLVDEIGTLLVHLGSIDATTKADTLAREISKIRRENGPKLARFEEGVPADPTENMTPEDAEKWERYNEQYGDKFKTAEFETPDPNESKDPISSFESIKNYAASAFRAANAGRVRAALQDIAWLSSEIGLLTQTLGIDDSGYSWKLTQLLTRGKNQVKTAGKALKWKALFPKSHSSHGHFFDATVDTDDGEYHFKIQPYIKMNGVHEMLGREPLYELLVVTPQGQKLKFRRVLTDIAKLKAAAESYAKGLQTPTGGVDFTREWNRLASSEDDEKLSRYEEGVPADPTENMDPEDAQEWRSNTEEYGDKFKAASDPFWKAI